MPKVKMEVVVAEDQVEAAVGAICDAARTGQVGDGKIFVSDIGEAVVYILLFSLLLGWRVKRTWSADKEGGTSPETARN